MSQPSKDIELPDNEVCPECKRVFNLHDTVQALEFFFGHDCEPMETISKDQ